jgi:hypothetical protein
MLAPASTWALADTLANQQHSPFPPPHVTFARLASALHSSAKSSTSNEIKDQKSKIKITD